MEIVASQAADTATSAGGAAVAVPLGSERAVQFQRDVVPLREPLYRRAMSMCRNRADAEDLVQETMLKAYSRVHTLVPDSNHKAWLYRILTNTYITGYRRKQRQPVQYSTEEMTDQDLAAHARHTSTGHVSAEDEALAALPDTEIMAAMQALPEQFRAVVYYADVEGFRYREIAEIMGTPNGTVMSRLSRGRQHLRRLLVDGASSERRERLSLSA